jgi:hypothetical protein
MSEQEEDELPWERRGYMRLDCEPHRARLVRFLGIASLVLGVLSLCGGVTGLAALPMGVAAWTMARADLAKMRAGLMDPRGEKRTHQGGDCGLFGMLLSLLALGFWALLFLDKVLPAPYGRGP